MMRTLFNFWQALRAFALAIATATVWVPVSWAQLPLSSTVGNTVTTDQVKAELLAHAPEGVTAGQPLWLGLQIQHQPHWHTYWKNPGDSGLPTSLTWTLPPGFVAGDIAWPVPKKLPVGPLVNYGYENTVLLPVSVTVPTGFAGAALDVKLTAQWLVCKEVCIPQEGEFSLRVPTRAATGLHAANFNAALASQPQTSTAIQSTINLNPTSLSVRVRGLPASWQGQAIDFLPELPGVVDHAAAPTTQWQGDTWIAEVPLSRERFESPARLSAVLLARGLSPSYRVAADVKGTWPALTSPASVGGTGGVAAVGAATEASVALGRTMPSTGEAPAAMGLVAVLLSALLGGLLLNLMPCVLPVLSLKVLGLTQHSADARTRVGVGLAYTVGVVLSFLALAGALLALRAGGEAVGWGFQLQSPWVVAMLAGLFTLIGLNLAGVFEVGTLVPNALATLRADRPWVDAALTGVLAVAVAAPCTAPFMGAALGLAMAWPTPQALLVFGTLGLGLALPFLAASLMPSLSRWLPRPGAWMVRFKVAMAFPMFATVVWLLWVLGQQVGIDGAAGWLAVLVALAFAAWALALRDARQRRAWGLSVLSVALVVGALTFVAPLLNARTTDAVAAVVSPSERWQPWSAALVAEHQAAGRTVFVDFTAAWCVTCQVNKSTTLNHADVLAAFAKHGVVTLRADWTRRDAAIAAEISRLGRSGVPVYAVYRAPNAPARVLPEVITASMVIDAVTEKR